jgi:decaprenylphospho-beta-D-erythro-pentofuranosid-2-ulose 2-reductase
MLKILIVGASSAIAEATARRYAARGARLHLLARDPERLAMIARDLEVRGAAAVTTALFDASQHLDAEALLAAALTALQGIDLVLFAHGVLSDQRTCEQSVAELRAAFEINTLSTLALLTPLAAQLQTQGHGTLAVISSVAGDRGRQSNYVYGASKAALDAFLSGLRNRLARHGVQVLTIKPGFVDTPMTAGFKKGPLWASPDTIAAGIVQAIESKRDVVYLPWFWRFIMLVIRSIPERLFKRLSL